MKREIMVLAAIFCAVCNIAIGQTRDCRASRVTIYTTYNIFAECSGMERACIPDCGARIVIDSADEICNFIASLDSLPVIGKPPHDVKSPEALMYVVGSDKRKDFLTIGVTPDSAKTHSDAVAIIRWTDREPEIVWIGYSGIVRGDSLLAPSESILKAIRPNKERQMNSNLINSIQLQQ